MADSQWLDLQRRKAALLAEEALYHVAALKAAQEEHPALTADLEQGGGAFQRMPLALTADLFWPDSWSRSQRGVSATKRCKDAGIPSTDPFTRRMAKDAADGMPLADVIDLINHEKETRQAETSPSPEPDPQPDVEDIQLLAAIIRRVDGSHNLGSAALAEAILRHPSAAGVFPVLPPGSVIAGLPDTSHLAPPPWPELPAEPPNSWLAAQCSPSYREGRRAGWILARITLADMNPNRQQEEQSNG